MASPSAVIQIENFHFAEHCVGSLSVQQRVSRALTQAGFHLTDQIPTLEPYLLVRGDVQYGLTTFRKVISCLGDANLSFFDRTGVQLPISWVVHQNESQKIALDVPPVIQSHQTEKQELETVSKACLDALFKEIFDGTEGWVARGLNKRLSFPLTRLLLRTTITPNVLTVIIFLMGLCGAFFVASSDYGMRVLGVSLLQLNSILDGCDGEIARIKGLTSKLGAWLDTIADDILNNVLFMALVFGIYRESGNRQLFTLGGLTTLASLGVSFFIYRFLIKNGTANAAHFKLAWEKPPVEGHVKVKNWFDHVKPVLKRDFFILVIWIFVVLNLRPALIVISAVPVWIAFFLYATSFLYEVYVQRMGRTAS